MGTAVRKRNGLAVTAGILGLGSIVVVILGFLSTLIPVVGPVGLACGCGLGPLMTLLGMIFGFVGQAQIKGHPEQTGKGWAVLGIVIGILSIILSCVIVIVFIVGGGAIVGILGPQIGNVISQITTQVPGGLLSTPVP